MSTAILVFILIVIAIAIFYFGLFLGAWTSARRLADATAAKVVTTTVAKVATTTEAATAVVTTTRQGSWRNDSLTKDRSLV